MFPEINLNKKYKVIPDKELGEGLQRIRIAKSLPSLKLSEMLYQKYIEQQYEDDLDKQAKDAGGDVNFHR